MSDMMKLRKFVSPEIIFGSGSRNLAGKYAKQFAASKALIVSDQGVSEAGWVDDVRKSLDTVEIQHHTYLKASPNPRSEEVMEGAEVFRAESCNIIISIGGGSPMDCAKGIGIVSSNNKNILEFEGVDKILMPVPPLIFIPTTSGTSSDVSQFSIIKDEKELVKIAIISKALVPDVSLIDPDTLKTMSSYLTACTGLDALVHAIEAYVSTASGVLTDMYALEAIRLINNNLPALINNLNSQELREKVMLASLQAGLAFSNAILGAVHAMSHSLGGFLDLPHGECNAMLLDHVINFNFNAAPDRFRNIAEAFSIRTGGMGDMEVKKVLLETVVKLKKEAGVINQLADKGVKSTDLSILSDKAFKDACMLTNPRKSTINDIRTIYKEAM